MNSWNTESSYFKFPLFNKLHFTKPKPFTLATKSCLSNNEDRLNSLSVMARKVTDYYLLINHLINPKELLSLS